ncbi:MAG: hypothetical protein JWQ02_2413 [Capsulimonas sp.]|jgi:hypothetical protein|nr:hypothetical protein [Capsulimonas sp.]
MAYTASRVVGSSNPYTGNPATYLNDGVTTTRADLVVNQISGGSYTGPFDLFLLDIGSSQVLTSISLANGIVPTFGGGQTIVMNVYGNNDGSNPRAGGTVNVLASSVLYSGSSTGTVALSGTYRYVWVEFMLTGTAVGGTIIASTGTLNLVSTAPPAPINLTVSQVY